MQTRLASDTLSQLASVLAGRTRLTLPGGITLGTMELPMGCPASALLDDGELFLFWDPDQPMAIKHAVEILHGHAAELLGVFPEELDTLLAAAPGPVVLARVEPAEAAPV